MKNHLFKLLLITAIIVIGACIVTLIIVLLNRTTPNSNTQTSITPTPTISLGQKATPIENVANFWSDAQGCCQLVGWYGDWGELAKNNGGVAGTTIKLAQASGLQSYVIVSPFNQSTGKFNLPVSDANTTKYLDSSEKFVKQYQPKYFGIGVEINLLYDKSPSAYQQFLQMYKLAYARIKSVSPTTQVFPVFQLEQLKGLRGGIFGGQNNTAKNDWNLLADFKDVSDLTGFTTYPGLIYTKPSDIPADYYTQIPQYTDKPVVFSEVGWFSTGVKGWESSQSEQADFVTTYFKLTQNVTVVFSAWAFLDDIPNQGIFSTMGLIDSNGNKKQAYSVWASH